MEYWNKQNKIIISEANPNLFQRIQIPKKQGVATLLMLYILILGVIHIRTLKFNKNLTQLLFIYIYIILSI